MKTLHLKFCLLALFVSAGWWVVKTGIDTAGPIKRIDPNAEIADLEEAAKELDVYLIGTSHGLAFRDLGLGDDVSIVNASQSGLGVAPLIVKCRHALNQIQKCRNVVIVIDEWQISSAGRSEGSHAFDAFEYDRPFLNEMLGEDFQRAVVARYVFGLFGNLPNLVYERAVGFKSEERETQAFLGEQQWGGPIDPKKAAGRVFKLYRDSSLNDAHRLSEKLAMFSDDLIAGNKAVKQVIFIFPPLPQIFRDKTPEVAKHYKNILLKALEGSEHTILDLSDIWPDEQYYSDEDHLTSDAARKLGQEKILQHLHLD
ncbi:hypothetical protein N9A94_00845 [Akkermansiaceae bacterium]|nr:hypothetical protein [Akkermansiaceae bacterium]